MMSTATHAVSIDLDHPKLEVLGAIKVPLTSIFPIQVSLHCLRPSLQGYYDVYAAGATDPCTLSVP